MTLTTLPVTMYYPPHSIYTNAALAVVNTQLNTAGHYIAVVMQAPVTDTLTKIGFMTGTVNANTLDVRVETVDSATGRPSGTLWAANTNFVQTVIATDDAKWFEVTLTAGASLNKGDLFAIVLKIGSSTSLQIAGLSSLIVPWMPGSWRNTGTPTVLGSVLHSISIYYSGAGYIPHTGICPVKTVDAFTFNNTSTPDVRGIKFTPAFRCKTDSVWCVADLDGDVTAKLYDTDGVTVLASTSFGQNLAGQAGPSRNVGMWNTEATLNANSTYYLGFEPSSASNVSLYSINFHSADIKKNYVDSSIVAVSAKDPTGTGSWTAVDTAFIPCGIGISAIDDGISLKTGPGMSGGMRG